MKKNCGSCEDCGVDVRTKATLSASNRLFMERGKKSLSGELEAVARYFVRNVETSLLGKLKWRVTWKQFVRGNRSTWIVKTLSGVWK